MRIDLAGHGLPRPSRARAVLLVNLRPASEDAMRVMGNRTSSPFFAFDLNYASPEQLLHDVVRRTQRLKASPLALIYAWIFSKGITHFIKTGKLRGMLLGADNTKVTATLSNVPGPQYQASLLGAKVDDIRFVVPTAPIHLGINVNSYNGRINAQFVLNREREADASLLARHWHVACDELYEAIVEKEKQRKGA